LPDLDPNLIPLPYISMSRSSSPVSITSPDSLTRKGALFKKRSLASFNADYRDSSEIVYSKDCFIRVLYDMNIYKDFEKFIEGEHCKENLLFFESYSKLEKILVENVPLFKTLRSPIPVTKAHPNASLYGGFISQFLRLEETPNAAGSGATKLNEIIIPSSLYSYFLLL
jgi:hypothetical protein